VWGVTQALTASADVAPGADRRPWRHPAFLWSLVGAGLTAALVAYSWESVSARLLDAEFAIAGLLPEQWIQGAAWFVLPGVALAAGLLASVSPCVLPLVPLNVALIGASRATGWRAASLSARFVLGAALVLAWLGLAADLAGWLLIEQRGWVLLAAGLLMVTLALVFLEILPLPFAGRSPGGAGPLGPTAAGAAFALITTPCASPLLAALLAAAGSRGELGLSAVAMVAFALGYTGLVFAAGVWGGSVVGRLRRRSFDAPRAVAGALLLVLGLGFAASGFAWF
jgi:cytochrome c-type biogenesis protein